MTRQAAHPVAEMFTARWSPRAFTGEAMPQADLDTLLEAARWAPSASNMQPWRFLYGHAGSGTFAGILSGLVPFNQGWAHQASVLLVVASKKTSVAPGASEAKANPWHAFDAGAAWMSLAIQAHLMGYITHGMGGFDAAALKTALQLPDDAQVHAVIAIGKRGAKESLPDGLQARELPNDRLPLSAIAAEGPWRF